MKKALPVLSMFIIAMLLVSSLTLAFPTIAQAKSAANPAEKALEQSYKTEQQWLNQQQETLNKTDQAAAKVQKLIDKAAAEGLDVTILENDLATFNDEMGTNKAEHQTAAEILAAHNGFDDQGSVTDKQAARQTVLDAKQAIWQAHVTLSQSVRNLYLAVREWRQTPSRKENRKCVHLFTC